ncbi:MAG: hypothetical protein EOP87_09815 [Verrucomicrobiaceae bacterium]|nr:MAG: hypothetical protein EOP87_09815 [Verrucomicrobiaceae bacterium]
MPRHAFQFPHEVVVAVRQHVEKAVNSIRADSARQEANYTAKLLGKLEGRAYDGPHGSVVFDTTIFDDRGPNSAENRIGADHAITATISDGKRTIRKAILVQAKLGKIEELAKRDYKFLEEQIRKMRRLVDAPKVMQIPQSGAFYYPEIVSGTNLIEGKDYKPVSLAKYFTTRVLTTLDGCTDPEIVSTVQQSTLSRVNISAKIKI